MINALFKSILSFSVLLILSSASFANTIYPQKLKQGDTVAIVTPCYKITKQQYEEAVLRVKALGFKVYVPKTIMDSCGCYAGTWDDRANELNTLFANKKVKGIFAVRGGAGASHVIDRLDYQLIKDNPKVIVGYSDMTAILNAISNKTGLVTFHGPMPGSKIPGFSSNYLKGVLVEGKALTFENESVEDDDLIQTTNKIKTIYPGKAKGKLKGGNLTVLTSLLGNAYLDTDWDNTILFLEDVGEDIYKIDRMLSQMRHAGILSKLKGVVFGTCIGCEAGRLESVSLDDTLELYFKNMNIPVFSGAMIGHQEKIFTVPVGAVVEIDANLGTIRMLKPATV